MCIFNKKWLNQLMQDTKICANAKQILVLAILNSEENIKITVNKLTKLSGHDKQNVKDYISLLEDNGWFVSAENGTSRVLGYISYPNKVSETVINKSIKEDRFEDISVRDWKPIHFVQFYLHSLGDNNRELEMLGLNPKLASRSLLKDGVNKLNVYDKSRTHPKIRYKEYLEWLTKAHPRSGFKSLRSDSYMKQFTKYDDNTKEEEEFGW